jgi:hypothetical protein
MKYAAVSLEAKLGEALVENQEESKEESKEERR